MLLAKTISFICWKIIECQFAIFQMLLYKIVETAISVGIETATPISTVPHEMRFVFVTQTQIIPVGIVDRRISGH